MGTNLIVEGFSFMLLGMSSVFLFLIIMVFVLKIQGFLLDIFFAKDNELNVLKTETSDTKDSSELVAVISSSICKFKQSKS